MEETKKTRRQPNDPQVRDRKSRARFVLVWLIAVLVILMLWMIVLSVVNMALKEYESVQPKYKAEEIFNDYFLTADAEKIVEYGSADISVFEKKSDAYNYFAGILGSGALSYQEVISPDSSVRMYAVAVNDITFGYFTVGTGTEETHLLKLKYPVLGSIAVNIKPTFGTSVFAPKNARVEINGIPADKSCIRGDDVVLSETEYFPKDDKAARTMVNYVINGLYSKPEVAVFSRDGKKYELVYDAVSGSYSSELALRTDYAEKYNAEILRLEEEKRRKEEEEKKRLEEEERKRLEISESIRTEYEPWIVEMSKQYNKFIYYPTTQALRDATKVYFKSGTDSYSYVTSSYRNWADYKVSSMDFSEIETSYYEWLNEGRTLFKCRITLNCNMNGKNTLTGETYPDTEYFAMTAYVDISGSKPLVTKLVTTEFDLQETAPKDPA
ncbi:MAG: hypothetical protein MJ137_03770 [Clostridia bacterium]|nr:hypothetical protein [Clostridia bacterium]